MATAKLQTLETPSSNISYAYLISSLSLKVFCLPIHVTIYRSIFRAKNVSSATPTCYLGVTFPKQEDIEARELNRPLKTVVHNRPDVAIDPLNH